jgi:hypothetical protein
MKLYEDRPYLKDARTGEQLNTEVMYDRDERIIGHREVLDRHYIEIPKKAKQLGGKGLQTRDFIEAFSIRGPSYGDVVRQTIDIIVAENRAIKRNIGTAQYPRYRYDFK